ncbi:hypothetical protein PHMEG_00023425 [Phytophthora megakarya]|uniref:Uncharacterized protein n=1 Tax=Phytophthora megakarya TaxID=4795 RepID=A0A225VIG6_9STRA|nr:hypothetical protein PHMEG_00023425 [Phytophthora megakarya]
MFTCSLTLHTIWTARNKYQFENGPPPKTMSALFRIYSIFSTHFRALLRSADPSMCEGLQRCLRGFPGSSRLGTFVTDHPRAISLRPRSLFSDAEGRLRAPPMHII